MHLPNVEIVMEKSMPNHEKKLEDRVCLRRLTRADLQFFFVWASNPEVTKTTLWEAYTSMEEAEHFLIQVAEKHPWFMAICLDGIPIGSLTLSRQKGRKAELGYVLAKEYWGHGIATIAVKIALARGFKELKLKKIEAFVDPDNIASQKVLIKAGMTCEGLLPKAIRFKGSLHDRYVYSRLSLK